MATDPIYGVFLYSTYGLLPVRNAEWALGPFFVCRENMRSVPENLLQMAQTVVEGFDLELWGLELLPKQSSGQLLRVYIENEGGVDVSQCEKVSRQLGAVLDVEDPIAGDYTLEVSSPGMDRPLFTQVQFERSVESDIRVKMKSTAVGRKNFRGRLLSVSDNDIVMQVDNDQHTLSIDQIDTARVVPQF